MGIPRFSFFIRKNFPQVYKKYISGKGDIDTLALDFNAMIYPCVHRIMEKCKKNKQIAELVEEEIIQEVIQDTESLIKQLNPKEVIIAIDGTCPMGKMVQQRCRRYMSILTKEKQEVSIFDTNCISPGTLFMKKLNQTLSTYFHSRPEVKISDSNNPSEGEHKLIRILSDYQNKRIVVNGLDGDLIVLTLKIAQKNEVYIRREQESDISYIYGHILSESLTQIAPLEDLILIFSLLGNDFVPEIKAVNDHASMKCDKIIEAYKKYKKKKPKKKLVNKDGSIDINNLIFFFGFLENLEKDTFSDAKIDSYYYYYQIYDKKKLVEEYFKTLTWIMYYYIDKRLCPSWSYVYPYKIAPFIKDISFYCSGISSDFQWLRKDYWYKDQSFKPEHQLLLILPYQSLDLIPNSYLVRLAKTVLRQFYPLTFQLDLMDTGKPSWMQKLFLPEFDQQYITEIVNLFT